MRGRLEYKIRGACVSIFCEPNSVDGASFKESVDRLATNWIASLSDMECKNVRVIVISTKHVKIRSNDQRFGIDSRSPTFSRISSWNRDGIQFKEEDQKNGSMLYLSLCFYEYSKNEE